MVSRSDQPTEVQARAAPRRRRPERSRRADRAASDQAPTLPRSALAFAARCHARQRRQSDGAEFIEHPLEVARLLRDAGCSDVVVAAGLLHDVVEDTHVGIAELRSRFGKDVAALVQAVSDDASVHSYRERKLMLREQVAGTGGDAALLFAADMIAKVRELPDLVRRDRERFDASARQSRARKRLERYHQLRLEHYGESLRVLRQVAPRHPLVRRLADELERCPVVVDGATTGKHA